MNRLTHSTVEVDVAVIGAGITGLSIARELSRYRLKIAVIDREEDVCCGTSKANSGIIHTGIHVSKDSVKGSLALQGNIMFDELSRDLSLPFQRTGELIVAMNEEECAQLEGMMKKGRENDVPGLRLMGGGDARMMEPNLSTGVVGALYAPTAGVIAPFEMSFALAENARENGVEFYLDADIVDCDLLSDSRFCLHTVSRKFIAPFVINAAGVNADRIAAMIDDPSVEIFVRKGEEYILDRQTAGLVRRIIFPVPQPRTKGILIIPTIGGPIMIGPTAEEVDDREDLSTTIEGLHRILSSARKIVPHIVKDQIIASFCGLRACARGDDFILRKAHLSGFVHAAGIQSPGLTAAPALARQVTSLLVEMGLPLRSADRFNPNRTPFVHFCDLDQNAAVEKIAEDPAYGHVVCRCELVTEAEIVEAVRRGANNLSGIKLRTRAGMGRCQGSFCTYRVVEILSRALGIPYTGISLKGRGSEVLIAETRQESTQ
jgi:glycerol-3-phosphate dehydrogenase